MDIEKLLNDNAIAPYYFAELGKKLSAAAAKDNFQNLVKSNAIDKNVLKMAKISFLSELQKEINTFLLKQVKEIKDWMAESILSENMRNELDKRLKLIDDGKAEFINYEDFKSGFLS